MSVTQHLTFHVFIRATNDTNLLSVENFKRFSLNMLRCEARAFPVGMAYGYMISRLFFTLWKTRMHMNLDHVTCGYFVLGRDVHCEIDYWPLAVSMQRYAHSVKLLCL